MKLEDQELGIADWEVLDLLTSLCDRSLVVYEEREGIGRYRLLETVRQYAAAKLGEIGEAEAVRDRHLGWCVGVAERAEPELTGAEQQAWLERLAAEHDNMRAALKWSRERDADRGLRLSGAIWRFWFVRGYLGEGRGWLAGHLSRSGGAPSAVRGKALNGAGVLAHLQGDYAAARAVFEESLATKRELGDRRGIAGSLINLGNVAHEQGDYAAASALYEESLAIQRELGDRWGIAVSLNNLGDVARQQGEYAQARALHEESLGTRRELGDRRGIALSLGNLGYVAYEQGDYAQATALHEESLGIRRDLGDRLGIAQCLEGLGEVAAGQGQAERALRLSGAAAALREAVGAPLPTSERARHERALSAARAALGDEAFAAALAEGRGMGLEQAIEYALEVGRADEPMEG